jgi:hypothetical protein
VLGAGIAAAAYALPGSPLPSLMQKLWGWISPSPSIPAVEPANTADGLSAGFAFPAGANAVIAFESREPGAVVLVTLVGGDSVRVRIDPAIASFASISDSHLSVLNTRARSGASTSPQSGRYEVEIPLNAPMVEVRVAGARLLLLERGRSLFGPAPDSTGKVRIPLS